MKGQPSRLGGAQGLRRQVADAFAGDFFEADRNIHQDVDQRGGFYGGVPAVDVVRGVGFGDAEGLRFFQSLIEGEALLHFAEDHVCGRVQDAVEALQVNRGELVEKRKDGDAVHHRGFEEKALALLRGKVAQFAVGVDDRAFVGGDGVGSVLESGADVVDGGLAVFHIEGRGFEEDVGLGGCRASRGRSRLRHSALDRRQRSRSGIPRRSNRSGIEAVWIGDPSQAARGDSGDAEVMPWRSRSSVARSSSRRTRVG